MPFCWRVKSPPNDAVILALPSLRRTVLKQSQKIVSFTVNVSYFVRSLDKAPLVANAKN